MDPVSSASGIAGLIAVAVKTIELVGEYVMIVHEHKKHVETLRKELELMKEVLEKLNEVIIGEKHSGEMTGVDGEDRNTVLGKAFSDCTNTIEQIQGKLKEPLGRLQKAMAKLKWPFEQKDVLRMVDKLRRYTQLFQLSLTAGNRQLLSKTFDAASEGLKLQRDSCKNMQKLWEGFPDMAKTAEKTLEQTETLLELVPTFLHEFSLDMKEIEFAQKEAERREQGKDRAVILSSVQAAFQALVYTLAAPFFFTTVS